MKVVLCLHDRETAKQRTINHGRKLLEFILFARFIGLLGSWEHRWYRLEKKDDSNWLSVAEVPSSSQAIYNIEGILELRLTLLLGIYPNSLVVVDPSSGAFAEMPMVGDGYSWLVSLGEARFLILGEFEISDYQCRRQDDIVSCTLSVGYQSGVGALGNGVFLSWKKEVALGNARGSLVVFSSDDLPQAPLRKFSRTLALGSR